MLADGEVVPISTATNQPGKPIKINGFPQRMAITPNGKTLYVTTDKFNLVFPINTASGHVGKAIKAGPVPFTVAVSPDGKTAYVLNSFGNTVTPINTATNRAGHRIKVGAEPDDIAFSPNGKTAYVLSDRPQDSVTPIDVATNKPRKNIMLRDHDELGMITADPNGKTLYFLDQVADTVTPIQLQTRTVGKPIRLPSGAGTMAISPDGKTLYVASQFAGCGDPDPHGHQHQARLDQGRPQSHRHDHRPLIPTGERAARLAGAFRLVAPAPSGAAVHERRRWRERSRHRRRVPPAQQREDPCREQRGRAPPAACPARRPTGWSPSW